MPDPSALIAALHKRLDAARLELHAAAGSPPGEAWNGLAQALETLKADVAAIVKTHAPEAEAKPSE